MIKPLDKIAFEYWAGVGSKSDLEDWAENELRKEESHPDACELFGLSDEEAQNKSLKIAKDITGFEPVSERGEKLARELLENYCKKLLAKEIEPQEYCHLVQVFEANFIGLRKLDDGSLEYPTWLGDLWNACDWCDKTWSLLNSPHLAEEVKRVLSNKKNITSRSS